MNWIDWIDHADEFRGCFIEEAQQDGSIKHTPVRGTVMQEGTPQDADHFNVMMQGIIENQLGVALLLNFARQQAWEIERGSVTLTNTGIYPYNNSAASVALSKAKESTDYIVLTEVSGVHGDIGEIVISDKLRNGFKVAFTGSAAQATVNYIVIGGYMK